MGNERRKLFWRSFGASRPEALNSELNPYGEELGDSEEETLDCMEELASRLEGRANYDEAEKLLSSPIPELVFLASIPCSSIVALVV